MLDFVEGYDTKQSKQSRVLNNKRMSILPDRLMRIVTKYSVSQYGDLAAETHTTAGICWWSPTQ